MPSFLDFVFPFGRQLYPQDFYFCGFRDENHLSQADRLPEIPMLGRSGREFRLCYNLKSVEALNGQPHRPWSVRQAAVHHSFDVENGRATWIIVKANELIKTRLMAETQSLAEANASSGTSTVQAFSSSLAVHLLVCNWSGEGWRWYINYLEETFHEITRRTVSVEVTRLPVSAPAPENRATSTITPRRGVRSLRPAFRRVRTQAYSMLAIPPRTHAHFSMEPQEPPELPPEPSKPPAHSGYSDFTFGDLQRTQFIEEKANEALLILKSNAIVLADLKDYYSSLTALQDFPRGLVDECREDVSRFAKRMARIENDMKMHMSRTELLVRLIADRKSLVRGSRRGYDADQLICAALRHPGVSKH